MLDHEAEGKLKMAADKITEIRDRIKLRSDWEQRYLHERLYGSLRNHLSQNTNDYLNVIDPVEDDSISLFFDKFDHIVK